MKEEGRRLSAETVHSNVNIISSLYVVCFYAGLWSKMHFSLWAPNDKPKSHCSFRECPSLRHLSYYRASLDMLLLLWKGAGSGAWLPGFEAHSPCVFLVISGLECGGSQWCGHEWPEASMFRADAPVVWKWQVSLGSCHFSRFISSSQFCELI